MQRELEAPYVVSTRSGACRYRRRVPAAIRAKAAQIGETLPVVWLRNFRRGTSDERIKRAAERLAAKHDAVIASIKNATAASPELKALIADAEKDAAAWIAGDESDRLEMLAWLKREVGSNPSAAVMANVIEHGGKYSADALTISQAYDLDKVKPKKNGKPRHQKPIQIALAVFKEAVGDLDIRAVKREHVAKMIVALQARGNDGATIQRRLTALRGVYTRTTKFDDVARKNPFADHDIADSAPSAFDKLPFNKGMLEKIDTYLASSKRVKWETRAILQAMKYTGCGPAEVGGLMRADVDVDAETPFIWIRENNVRSLKNEGRPRHLPLIGAAFDAIGDAVARAKRANRAQLFPGFKGNANALSAKINKAIRAAKVTHKRVSAYSYRHTLEAALIDRKESDPMRRYILGHGNRDSHERYGAPLLPLADTKAALERALPFLGDVSPMIYEESESE